MEETTEAIDADDLAVVRFAPHCRSVYGARRSDNTIYTWGLTVPNRLGCMSLAVGLISAPPGPWALPCSS